MVLGTQMSEKSQPSSSQVSDQSKLSRQEIKNYLKYIFSFFFPFIDFTFLRLELPSHSLPLCNPPSPVLHLKIPGQLPMVLAQVPIFCAEVQGSCATYPEKYFPPPPKRLTSSSKLWVQVCFYTKATHLLDKGRRKEQYLNKEPLPTCQWTKDLKEQSQEDLGPLYSTSRVKGQCWVLFMSLWLQTAVSVPELALCEQAHVTSKGCCKS